MTSVGDGLQRQADSGNPWAAAIKATAERDAAATLLERAAFHLRNLPATKESEDRKLAEDCEAWLREVRGA